MVIIGLTCGLVDAASAFFNGCESTKEVFMIKKKKRKKMMIEYFCSKFN